MKYLSWILNVVLIVTIIAMLKNCHCPAYPEFPDSEPKKEALKEKIVEKEKEVDLLKEKKKGITYTTSFGGFKPKKDSTMANDTMAYHGSDCDTMVQIIYVELIKCDSIVKIDSVIIASQDTIITDLKQVNTIVEADNSTLKKDLKKQKRKNTITKIVAVVVIVASFLLQR